MLLLITFSPHKFIGGETDNLQKELCAFNVSVKFSKRKTHQNWICLSGNLSWLRECLDNRVGVNGLDKAGNTALYWACHGGHKGIGELI